jgi:hypothetical protein
VRHLERTIAGANVRKTRMNTAFSLYSVSLADPLFQSTTLMTWKRSSVRSRSGVLPACTRPHGSSCASSAEIPLIDPFRLTRSRR